MYICYLAVIHTCQEMYRKLATTKLFKPTYLFIENSLQNHIIDALKSAFPDSWSSIFNIVILIFLDGKRMMHAEDWGSKNYIMPSNPLTSQRIS
jgi:hypothetical protein